MTVQTFSKCALTSIAPEIRLRIYEHIFKHNGVKIYQDGDSDIGEAANLVMTCRLIYAEARDVFYEHTPFAIFDISIDFDRLPDYFRPGIGYYAIQILTIDDGDRHQQFFAQADFGKFLPNLRQLCLCYDSRRAPRVGHVLDEADGRSTSLGKWIYSQRQSGFQDQQGPLRLFDMFETADDYMSLVGITSFLHHRQSLQRQGQDVPFSVDWVAEASGWQVRPSGRCASLRRIPRDVTIVRPQLLYLSLAWLI